MKRLVAKRPILYMGRQYEVGDVLPAYDTKLVEAWLRAKSAEMCESAEEKAAEEAENVAELPLEIDRLSEMSKDELTTLAEKMNVELPKGATRAVIIEKLSTKIADVENGEGEENEHSEL